MIKLFRTVRQKLLYEGNVTKYLKYAIGEIVLVVIGILIALQINNWNETKKQKASMLTSIKSLIEDYKLDTFQLTEDIRDINLDLERLNDFRVRLSVPTANIDTLIHIARYEYLPFFNPSNELNRNTIISLLSTSHLDYFDEEVKSIILSHNAEQLRWIKIMDENVAIFLNSQYSLGQGLGVQSESSNAMMVAVSIQGPLAEKYWGNYDDNKLITTMFNTISGKMLMHRLILLSKETILEKTNESLDFLNNYVRNL